MAEISAQLAAYTALVESARANNRQGFPIGSGYLREASSLMQTSLLPGAEKIYTANLATLTEDQRAVGSLPTVGLVLLALALVAIGVGSVILYRPHEPAVQHRACRRGGHRVAGDRMDRRGHPIGGGRDREEPNRGHRAVRTAREGSHPRPAGPHRRDPGADRPWRHQRQRRSRSPATSTSWAQLLDAAPTAATDAVQKWTASHRKQTEAYEGGDYPAAVAQAIGTDPAASAAQFAAVESSLRDGIERTRDTLRDRVAAAGAWLAWSPTGALVLMVVAAVAAAVGLWPRLKEFL